MTLRGARAALYGALCAGLCPPAWAQSDNTSTLPQVEVVAPTPLLGSGIARDQAPASVHVLTRADIARSGVPDLLGALDQQVAGVALDDAQGNPFQPNLEYRGFVASPADGTPQGLAVYLNGVRFNAPFSDAVNWDLLPSVAIDSTNLEGANPVFGLNALGGSLSIQMKTGFTWNGAEGVIYGGSFGTVSGTAQYGIRSGDVAAYMAANVLRSDGWRQLNSSALNQFYGDIGWRSPRAEVHVNVLGDDNTLNNPGTVPVQLLSVDRTAVFTAPNRTTNSYALLSLSGTWSVSDAVSMQALLYYTHLSQRIANGNAAEAVSCAGSSATLCDGNDIPLLDTAGVPIPDFLNGGPYSELNELGTDTNGYGGSVQMTHDATVAGHHNLLVAGLSFDGGLSDFSANTLLGGVTDVNGVFVGPGIAIDQPGGPIAPVRLGVTTAYYGAYIADVFDITRALSLSLAGRLNVAAIDLDDMLGTGLSGNHSYTHFNPGIGLTWRITPSLSAYASYAVGNRAPTPAELSCASPQSPCTLANFFTGDPNLQQVVSHSIEAGLRGQVRGAGIAWNLGLFRTSVSNDILFVASSVPGLDFFQNVPQTLRQGIEAGLTWNTKRAQFWANYAYTRATFESAVTLDSPLNPAADPNGQIHVVAGDQLPGVPAQRLKIGMNYAATDSWMVGFSAIVSSGQYLFGDEANLTPKTNPYVVLNLNTSYRVRPGVELFALVRNLLNIKYETYGTFSPTSLVPIAAAPGASETRSLSPAPPIGAYGGLRVRF
ncbi:MAG TPA: TonB-dependent receptor [Acetobacteraceae bacterium]|nr:TonB-dependent receptor [Acetobacteraceae bacterium]